MPDNYGVGNSYIDDFDDEREEIEYIDEPEYDEMKDTNGIARIEVVAHPTTGRGHITLHQLINELDCVKYKRHDIHFSLDFFFYPKDSKPFSLKDVCLDIINNGAKEFGGTNWGVAVATAIGTHKGLLMPKDFVMITDKETKVISDHTIQVGVYHVGDKAEAIFQKYDELYADIANANNFNS